MSELMNFICRDSPYVSSFSPFNPFFSWFLMLPNIVCCHFCVSGKQWSILRTVFLGLHFYWNETKNVFNKCFQECFLIVFAFSLHPLFGINAWFSSWTEISNVNSTLYHVSFGEVNILNEVDWFLFGLTGVESKWSFRVFQQSISFNLMLLISFIN